MPYIGNQHNVGDHVNNFKVLDDISSHTATFDGSATSIVSAADDTIRIPEHRFIQGQRVTYTNGGGGNIGGLTSGTAYFISFDTANTIKLATTLANANSNTVINLTAVGSGTSHTLNVAFDGVNTKFKMTHGSGKAARLNNATQINVAINNVIQRPNINSVSFTEGFALEDNHKIVFKNAPTVNDIFWGSIIANTIENFDLRDNEVDNFTGDGSTTEFTLSTIPANNESVIVTIDGALQHPSDKNTTRAYTLIDSIIEFSAAPALNAEIQVRHIGFAGASTNDVSGFYGRTGNVALTSSDNITTGDITPRNINASGIITATTFDGAFSSSVGGSNANFTGIVTAGVFKGGDIEGRNLKITGLSTFTGAVNTQALTATSGTFSGNVSIGGTLTYEDVTNIDSVGIITARDGIDCNADLDVDGHTNLDNLSVAGVSTFNDNVILAEQKELRLEPSGAFKLYRGPGGGGANNFIKSTFGSINLEAANSFIVKVNNNEDSIAAYANDRVDLYHNNQIKLTTTDKGITVGTGVTIETNGQANFVGVTTFGNVVGGATTSVVVNRDLILRDVWGYGNHIKFHWSTNTLNFPSASLSNIARVPNLSFGDRTNNGNIIGVGDFLMYHDHYNMHMRYYGANGNLVLSNKNTEIHISGANGSGAVQQSIRIKSGATEGVILHHGGNAKFETAGIGASVYGTLVATGADINGDLDVDGHTNLDNVSIAGVTTFTGAIDANSTLEVAGVANFDSTVQVAEKIEHLGDTDTYLQFDTNTINLHSGGTTGLSVLDASVRVPTKLGINGAAPQVPLDVISNGSGYAINVRGRSSDNIGELRFTSNNYGALYGAITGGPTYLKFATGGTNRWYINSSGHFVPNSPGSYDIGSTSLEIGSIYLGVNKRVYCGLNQELELYTDGTNGYLKETNGDLYLQSTTDDIIIRAADNISIQAQGGEYGIDVNGNGSVNLYYDGGTYTTPKLSTTATGITVDGEVAASQDYPNFRPTLDLNFAASKKLDPSITYTRTGAASFTNKFREIEIVGDNTPRFDYDVNTGESLGLLIEESRINYNTNSEVGNNVLNNGVTTNETTDFLTPEGKFGRCLNVQHAGSSVGGYFRRGGTITISSGSKYTMSVFIRQNGNDIEGISSGITGGLGLYKSGTGQNQNFGFATADVKKEQYAHGWTRFSATFTATGNGTVNGYVNFVLNNPTLFNWNYQLWGFQLEASSYVTSYIPTQASTVTRGADIVLLDDIENEIGYNQLEGTVVADFKYSTESDGAHTIFSFSGTESNPADQSYRSWLRINKTAGTPNTVRIYQNGDYNDSSATATPDVYQKVAYAYSSTDQDVSLNGASVIDASRTPPTNLFRLSLGNIGWSLGLETTALEGHIKRFIYYPKKLSNSQLNTLTS